MTTRSVQRLVAPPRSWFHSQVPRLRDCFRCQPARCDVKARARSSVAERVPPKLGPGVVAMPTNMSSVMPANTVSLPSVWKARRSSGAVAARFFRPLLAPFAVNDRTPRCDRLPPAMHAPEQSRMRTAWTTDVQTGSQDRGRCRAPRARTGFPLSARGLATVPLPQASAAPSGKLLMFMRRARHHA